MRRAAGQPEQRLLGATRPERIRVAGRDDEARLSPREALVPADLAITGYTDSPAAALVEPPLTMVSVPAGEIGIQAMQTLAELIRGKKLRTRRKVLDVELVVRESCGSH